MGAYQNAFKTGPDCAIGDRGGARARPAPAIRDIEAPIPADFRLKSGDRLTDTRVRLRLYGSRNAPMVMALGGISAGRDVAGWWRDAIFDAGGVNLDRFALLGLDFAPTADAQIRITPRDQARLIVAALDWLGVDALHGFVGASYGGLVGLALGALAPERLERLCVISAAHRQSAQALAWRGLQRRILAYAAEKGEPAAGLALARQLAMITYRTADEFDARFGAGIGLDGAGSVDRYLEARGRAYSETAQPHRWLSLSESIDRANIDPAAVATPATLIACAEDQLVPLALMRELAETLPHTRALHVINSQFGHDAFLKAPAGIAPLIAQCLENAP